MAVLDFQAYLNSFVSAPVTEDWGDGRYTATTAELPLQVQTIVEESQPDDQHGRGERLYSLRHGSASAPTVEPGEERTSHQEQPKREQFAVLDGLRKLALAENQHVLLVGRPGSGKSTALRRLLWEEAQSCLAAIENNQESFRIPILIELRSLHSSVIKAIQEQLEWWHDELDEKTLKACLRQQKFLVLLDGLNELSHDSWKFVEEFKSQCSKLHIPLIFTTRELGAGRDLGIEKKLEMLPLTEPQMREFIHKRLLGQAEQLLRQMQGSLRELAETPLFLKMLCDVVAAKPDGRIPQNRGDLFRQEFARRYKTFKPEISRAISDDSRRFTFELLCHLAFAMIMGESSYTPISKSKAENILAKYLAGEKAPNISDKSSAKEWLEDLIKWDLLEVAKDSDDIKFHHQLFQEYYAAEYLLENRSDLLRDENSFTQLQMDYLNYIKWTECIKFMASLESKSESVTTLIKLALNVDLRLGSELAGEVKIEHQECAIDELINLNTQKLIKIQLIGQSRSIFADRYLIDSLKNGLPNEREEAARILGLLKSKEAKECLIKALNDSNYRVRWTSVIAVGRLGIEEAIPSLINILNTNTRFILLAVIDSLSLMQCEKANQALIRTLQSPHVDVRLKAAYELGKQGYQEGFQSLLQALGEQDTAQKSRYSLKELCHLTSIAEILRPKLINIFKDSGSVSLARQGALDILGYIGDDNVIKMLYAALEDNDHSVKYTSIRILCRINNRLARKCLVDALTSKPLIRDRIIDDLIRYETPNLVPILLHQLKDGNELFYEKSALALASRDIPEGISALVKIIETCFQNREYDICENYIEVISRIRPDLCVPFIQELLTPETYGPHGFAVDIAGQLNKKELIPHLLMILENHDLFLSLRAAMSLTNLNNEKGAKCLLKSLDSKDPSILINITYIIDRLNSDLAIQVISKALHIDNHEINMSCMYALKNMTTDQSNLVLISALNHSNSSIVSASMNILSSRKNESVVPLLVEKALNHENPYPYLDLLAIIESEQSVSILVSFLESDNVPLRKNSIIALEKVDPLKLMPFMPILAKYVYSQPNLQDLNILINTQDCCGFYNYEIWQAAQKQRKLEKNRSQNPDKKSSVTVNIDSLGILQTGTVNVKGNQVGIQDASGLTQSQDDDPSFQP